MKFSRRRNFSLVARYSLKFTRSSLLVIKSLVSRYKIRLFFVVEVTRWKNSLVAHCRSCSFQKITRYSLQKVLIAKNHSLLVAKFTPYLLQKLLFAKNHWLLVAKFALYSLQQIIRYSLQKIIHHSLKQSQVHKVRWKFFQYNLFSRAKKFKLFKSTY